MCRFQFNTLKRCGSVPYVQVSIQHTQKVRKRTLCAGFNSTHSKGAEAYPMCRFQFNNQKGVEAYPMCMFQFNIKRCGSVPYVQVSIQHTQKVRKRTLCAGF